jgi:hypothetical protein
VYKQLLRGFQGASYIEANASSSRSAALLCVKALESFSKMCTVRLILVGKLENWGYEEASVPLL